MKTVEIEEESKNSQPITDTKEVVEDKNQALSKESKSAKCGVGNYTSWHVYVTQNAGTITLKTLDGSVVKTVEIIQTETPPKITYYEGGSINAQGRGKEIRVTG